MAQVALSAPVPIPDHATVKHPHELVHCNALPVPSAEELDFQPAEEALHARAVERVAFARHRPHDAAIVADANPPGPAMMPSAVRVSPGRPLPELADFHVARRRDGQLVAARRVQVDRRGRPSYGALG